MMPIGTSGNGLSILTALSMPALYARVEDILTYVRISCVFMRCVEMSHTLVVLNVSLVVVVGKLGGDIFTVGGREGFIRRSNVCESSDHRKSKCG